MGVGRSVKSRLWSQRPDVVAAVGNKASHEDDGRFWISQDDFFERFETIDLCQVSGGRLKERNVLQAGAAPSPDGAAHGSPADDDDWLGGIGAKAARAPVKRKAKKGKKKH